MIWLALIGCVLLLCCVIYFLFSNLLMRIEKVEYIVSEMTSDEDSEEDDPEIIELLNGEVD